MIAAPFGSIWRHRDLISQLVKREVLGRYRGSVFGLLWSFLHPLLMLLVYMFVFGVIFRIRWGTEESVDVQFGVVFFAGLIVHALFAECLTRSPAIVLSNVQFVKKVVFPLEILAVVVVISALFHMAIGFLILLLFNGLAHQQLPATVFYVPVIIAPLVLLSVGLSWFLASLGVFLRDIAQITGILATVLLFLCPIFYPLSAVPETLQGWIYWNPLTLIVQEMRNAVIFAQAPDWSSLGLYYLVALGVFFLGYLWFDRTRRAFADVL